MKKLFVLGLLCTALTLPALADIIFDNSANDLATRFEPGLLEVGDQIFLSGTARYLTNFSFEYWGTNTDSPANLFFSGNLEARVRFYLNDGPLFNGSHTPATVFYDSDWFAVPGPTPRNTLVFVTGWDFPNGGLYIPSSDITWSVQFRGMGPTDRVGVDLYAPAVAGGEFSDYWENSAGMWTLKTNSVAVDFAAKMSATFQATVGNPPLQISTVGSQAILRWPVSATNFVLETANTLDSGATWTPLTNGVTKSGNTFLFTTNIQPGSAFFRLHQQ